MLYYSEKSIGFPSIIFPLDDLEKIREVVTYSIKEPLYFYYYIYKIYDLFKRTLREG